MTNCYISAILGQECLYSLEQTNRYISTPLGQTIYTPWDKSLHKLSTLPWIDKLLHFNPLGQTNRECLWSLGQTNCCISTSRTDKSKFSILPGIDKFLHFNPPRTDKLRVSVLPGETNRYVSTSRTDEHKLSILPGTNELSHFSPPRTDKLCSMGQINHCISTSRTE